MEHWLYYCLACSGIALAIMAKKKTASWKTFTKHIRHFQACEDIAEVKRSVHASRDGNQCLTADPRTDRQTAR